MPRAAILASLLFALPAIAGPDLNLPVRHLKFAKGVTFKEGTRGLREAFPYIEALGARDRRGTALTPDSLKHFLDAPLHATGKRHNAIKSKEAAIEAVRLFVAGPLVRKEAKAKVMIAKAKELKKRIKHLDIKIPEHRPKSYELTAEPMPRDVAGRRPVRWKVSLVAFEMDTMLRLVHVDARVSSDGDIHIKRRPIIDGPMTSWQSGVVVGIDGMPANGGADKDKKMRAEALLARREYAKALAPARDLDSAWAIARLMLTPEQVRDLWGKESRVVGSGLRLVAYDLKRGSSVVFDATVSTHPIQRFTHRRFAQTGLSGFGPVLHRFAAR
ncbi:MAG: hypothetical protein ACYTGZ_20100 [Planctomycetota bacterium]|jgi:hypothetical protein